MRYHANMTINIQEYLGLNGKSPFTEWFSRLDSNTAAKVSTALTRMEMGNLSNAKSISAGLLEYRIHYGAGIRIYFGKDGDRLIILLGGGTKRRQQKDIEVAQQRWREYQQRKKRQKS